jgi:hypothetical protein
VNDLKGEIADLESHLKMQKEHLREAQLDITELKRSNN